MKHDSEFTSEYFTNNAKLTKCSLIAISYRIGLAIEHMLFSVCSLLSASGFRKFHGPDNQSRRSNRQAVNSSRNINRRSPGRMISSNPHHQYLFLPILFEKINQKSEISHLFNIRIACDWPEKLRSVPRKQLAVSLTISCSSMRSKIT